MLGRSGGETQISLFSQRGRQDKSASPAGAPQAENLEVFLAFLELARPAHQTLSCISVNISEGIENLPGTSWERVLWSTSCHVPAPGEKELPGQVVLVTAEHDAGLVEDT